MTQILALSIRNTKEIVRDKVNMLFGIGFPVILLVLLTIIASNAPVEVFKIEQLTPGIAVFSLSFVALFSGVLIAKDRSSAFMLRIFTAPIRPFQCIIGYVLPFIPFAFLQIIVCFITAYFLHLEITWHILMVVIVLVPSMLLFIGIGLLCGCLFNDKQVGGVCGALLTNVSAWLSGTWFDVSLVGGVFSQVANALPFIHAVNAARFALQGQYDKIFTDVLWVIGYAIVIIILAIYVFMKKMKTDIK